MPISLNNKKGELVVTCKIPVGSPEKTAKYG